MVSTFHGLELGKRGLMVGQANIATTGHNIANANTKGYSRQQVNATTTPSLNVWTNGSVNPGQLGTGVALDSITRVRDKFLDERFRDQSSKLGEASIKQDTLDKLETIINEPSETGLNSSMDQLWAAWQDLANEPDSLSAKAVIKERAQSFIDTAQAMNSAMKAVDTDLDNQLTAKMNEANQYLEQILH
jgi:flagellar hook-associated protein 1 FlgK